MLVNKNNRGIHYNGIFSSSLFNIEGVFVPEPGFISEPHSPTLEK